MLTRLTRSSPISGVVSDTLSAQITIQNALTTREAVSAEIGTSSLYSLALFDLSMLPKLGVRGYAASHWLQRQGLPIPENTYQAKRMDDDGWIVRLPGEEFFIEYSTISNEVASHRKALYTAAGPDVTHVERQEATILLTGYMASRVLSQACAFDFREPQLEFLVMSKIAGINCGILPWYWKGAQLFHIWIDATYAASLWESLLTLCHEQSCAFNGCRIDK